MAPLLVQAVGAKRNAARALSARAALFLGYISKSSPSPVPTDEERRRKGYLLNIILILSLAYLIILGTTTLWNWAIKGGSYDDIHPLVFGGIIVFYGALLLISKRGHVQSASFILVASDMLGVIWGGWVWGASLPETLLFTALIIVTASVLLGSTKGFIVAGAMIGALSILGIHEATVLNVPDWRYDEITAADVISYSALLLFMSFVGWLSNREIRLSLDRTKRSEKALEEERNMLERRVAERTKEMVALERKNMFSRMETLDQAAHIGELSQGVLHDLMSPLSAIALYVEDIARTGTDVHAHDGGRMREMMEKAVETSKRMRSFMESVRRHIDPGEKCCMIAQKTDIGEEIEIARDILAYKARMANVRIIIEKCDPIEIAAHPVRIHQVFLNLMSNAIDACTEASKEKSVHISAVENGENLLITVADTGCGMTSARLESLFGKPSTTKPRGTGIGLMTVRSIVEGELGGSIMVKSEEGVGTTFILTIPMRPMKDTETKKAVCGINEQKVKVPYSSLLTL